MSRANSISKHSIRRTADNRAKLRHRPQIEGSRPVAVKASGFDDGS
jgi:hypothetical protein